MPPPPGATFLPPRTRWSPIIRSGSPHFGAWIIWGLMWVGVHAHAREGWDLWRFEVY